MRRLDLRRLAPAAAILVAVSGWAPAPAADEPPQKQFSDALAEAKVNLATDDGQSYDRALSQYLRQRNAAVLSGCFKANAQPDVTPFDMVFRLAKDGSLLDVIAWPETNISRCLGDGLKAETFPAPPRDSYWAQLRMSFGR